MSQIGSFPQVKGEKKKNIYIYVPQIKNTPPKSNMEPENDGFQKKYPFPGAHFQVPC